MNAIAEKIIIRADFIDEAPVKRLAYDEAALHKALHLDTRPSFRARQKAANRILSAHGIEWEPGRVVSIAKVQKALSAV